MAFTLGPTGPWNDTLVRPFLVSIDIAGGRVTLHGDLDRQHVGRLLQALGTLTNSPSPSWTVDASDLTFCDAAGLRGLMAGQQAARDAGRVFMVARPSPWLRHLFRLVGLGAADPLAAGPSSVRGGPRRLTDA